MEDWVAVAEVANAYYRAMHAGDEEVLRSLFDERAPVVGTAGGEHVALSLDTFIERSVASRGTHGDAESRIDSLAVIGDTAQVTVGGRYRMLWFTDTLLMVREAVGWRIHAKTFFADSASPERGGGHGSAGDCDSAAAAARTYYRAMVNADRPGLTELFAADAPVVGTMDDTFMWTSREAFIAETEDLKGQHGIEEGRVDAVQVTGDMALVTVGGRYWTRWFTDQLAMVREDGAWIVRAKTFYAHPQD